MAEVTNGKLGFSAQEIQNRLEQVEWNENHIYEIDDEVTRHTSVLDETVEQVKGNSNAIADNNRRIGELGNKLTNVYTKEEVNNLLDNRGVCSLSEITYNNDSTTENNDGTTTKTYAISSVNADYRKMISYDPMILRLESNVISFTKTVHNLHTESYKWDHPVAGEINLILNIEEGIFYITGSTSSVDKVSSQDLPTNITFKYL